MSDIPEPLNIHKRILAIMADIHYICKGDKKVNGQYSFVAHDQVTEALQPLLVKHGVTAIATTVASKQDNNRTECQMRVVYTNVDNPADAVAVDFVGYGIDAGDKGPGKAVSYATKYAHLKTFNIATGDDPDKDAGAKFEPAKCTEFDSLLPEKTNEKLMKKFLEHSAEAMGKHVEDVKREAVARMDDFMRGYDRWAKKQSNKEKV
jgi:hypothetical protein